MCFKTVAFHLDTVNRDWKFYIFFSHPGCQILFIKFYLFSFYSKDRGRQREK